MTVSGKPPCQECTRDRYFVRGRARHAGAEAQRFCVFDGTNGWLTIMSLRSTGGARTRYNRPRDLTLNPPFPTN
jgi:hypothetical protein